MSGVTNVMIETIGGQVCTSLDTSGILQYIRHSEEPGNGFIQSTLLLLLLAHQYCQGGCVAVTELDLRY